MENDRGRRFVPPVGNRPVGPIYVFSVEAGHIGLRAAKMPAEPVKRPHFLIWFTRHNALMFFQGDGAFVTELNSRPLSPRDDGPGNPAHVHGKVVQTSEEDIGGHRSAGERA